MGESSAYRDRKKDKRTKRTKGRDWPVSKIYSFAHLLIRIRRHHAASADGGVERGRNETEEQLTVRKGEERKGGDTFVSLVSFYGVSLFMNCLFSIVSQA